MAEKANNILAKLAHNNPDPVSELYFANSWQLLVAVILSAQSTDKQVNLVTKNLFARYPDARSIAALTPELMEQEIKGVGLNKNKARFLVETARIVVEKHGGQVPGTMTELVSLPGVGRKTANVVLSNAFGIPALAVDTHVFRVANRLGLAKGKTADEVEEQLVNVFPRELWSKAHHWLILHGRYICLARKPRCDDCPLTTECDYYQRNQAGGTK